jgi:hypothetical protein
VKVLLKPAFDAVVEALGERMKRRIRTSNIFSEPVAKCDLKTLQLNLS